MFYKVFFCFPSSAKKAFIGGFLLSTGILLTLFGDILQKLILKKPSSSMELEAVKNSNISSVSYQELFDENQKCLDKLKTYKRWTIGCLLVGWLVVWIGKQFPNN